MTRFMLLIMIILILILSCSGLQEIQKKDNLGRVTRVAYYNSSDLDHVEEIQYYGNSHNPSIIVYKKSVGMDLIPYKEEMYQFKGNNLVQLSFFVYENKKKMKTGMIKYNYTKNNISRIEYYSYLNPKNKMFIFGLDQFSYNNRELTSRRIIEYEFNPDSQKSMQIGQYVIYYQSGEIISMKSWIMDKKSKKIIEKNEDNTELVVEKIGNIEKYYSERSRGTSFLNQ